MTVQQISRDKLYISRTQRSLLGFGNYVLVRIIKDPDTGIPAILLLPIKENTLNFIEINCRACTRYRGTKMSKERYFMLCEKPDMRCDAERNEFEHVKINESI